jgi:hypothetical protein
MARILLVGLDPETVDFSDPALPPGMTVEKIRAGIFPASSSCNSLSRAHHHSTRQDQPINITRNSLKTHGSAPADPAEKMDFVQRRTRDSRERSKTVSDGRSVTKEWRKKAERRGEKERGARYVYQAPPLLRQRKLYLTGSPPSRLERRCRPRVSHEPSITLARCSSKLVHQNECGKWKRLKGSAEGWRADVPQLRMAAGDASGLRVLLE